MFADPFYSKKLGDTYAFTINDSAPPEYQYNQWKVEGKPVILEGSSGANEFSIDIAGMQFAYKPELELSNESYYSKYFGYAWEYFSEASDKWIEIADINTSSINEVDLLSFLEPGALVRGRVSYSDSWGYQSLATDPKQIGPLVRVSSTYPSLEYIPDSQIFVPLLINADNHYNNLSELVIDVHYDSNVIQFAGGSDSELGVINHMAGIYDLGIDCGQSAV